MLSEYKTIAIYENDIITDSPIGSIMQICYEAKKLSIVTCKFVASKTPPCYVSMLIGQIELIITE